MNSFKIAVLGNRNETYLPHVAMDHALIQLQHSFPFSHEWIATEDLKNDAFTLFSYQGILAGSGPYESKEGILNGIQYAIDYAIPFFGTCSGFQYAILAFAKFAFDVYDVHHPSENLSLRPNKIFLQPLALCNVGMHSVLFGTLPGTKAASIYGTTGTIFEESHCNYGVNQKMLTRFAEQGLIVSGIDADGEPKIMEYVKIPFFVITLFLPQLNKYYNESHPLLHAFLSAAAEYSSAEIQSKS